MNLLGIETSGTVGSVALLAGSRVLVREIATPREQTEKILALIDALLAAASTELAALDGIAFGRGPGSFTGLRVSTAVAQGLGSATGVPLIPVSSLLCLAESAWREQRCEHCLVCVDAHMGQVYWVESARCDGIVQLVSPERLGAPAEVVAPTERGWAAVGSGFSPDGPGPELATVLASAGPVLPSLQASAQDLFPAADRKSTRLNSSH